MTPFYGWGSTASRLHPLRGGSLLFTTKFPEIPGEKKHENSSECFTYRLEKTIRVFNQVFSKMP